MRSILSLALSLAVSATLPSAFALFLAITASLKGKYKLLSFGSKGFKVSFERFHRR
jgi:hypothetical protein